MTGTPRTIVAGFDGSARSRSAVEWAAAEAVAHGDSLRVISVFDWTRNAPTVRDASKVEEYRELALSMMSSRVDELGAEYRNRYPSLLVSCSIVSGLADDVLARAAGQARLLAIGQRSGGWLEEVALGSVTASVVDDAPCPVVIVPKGYRNATDGHDVVVGVDGSPSSLCALAFGLAFARVHGSTVTAVRACGSGQDDVRASEHQLARDVGPVVDGDVPTLQLVAAGDPADVLVDNGTHTAAGLLVVGTRSRGMLRSMMLGSVSHDVMQRSSVPVAVVKDDRLSLLRSDGSRSLGQPESACDPSSEGEPKGEETVVSTLEEANADETAPHEAWALLRTATVGRLAVVGGDGPEIFPVNFVVDHGSVVFRTAAGSKLAMARGHQVAFEADGYTETTREAWSVVLKGVAREVVEMYEALDALELGTMAWHPSSKPYILRIEGDITGRRFIRRSAGTDDAVVDERGASAGHAVSQASGAD